ncbi:MAG: carboxypeptidase-like regulatory domain-containing protein, partial [Planctomycetaceae bacterium]|nr:carboxypeptidase-like regulatory domain-containing protein [Planctomycetaceae bacterium]
MKHSQKNYIFLVIFITGILLGCHADKTNPEFRNVTGTVVFNGSPVEGARLTFFPLDDSGISATGFTDAQGKYSLTATNSLVGGTGTKPGQYRVIIKKTEILVDKNREDLEA